MNSLSLLSIPVYLFVIVFSVGCQGRKDLFNEIEVWLSEPEKNILFEKQVTKNIDRDNDFPVLVVDPETTFQAMDGFGYTLTGGSARLINEMNEIQKTDLLKELFSANEGIGVNYLRLSIGASDLSDSVFSYNDLPFWETDMHLQQFSIEPEYVHLIPILKDILQINPDIKIMGSPWSAPSWMKTNKNPIGGSLKKEYFHTYALYFVKYIKEMEEQGIVIDAITIQNEPLHPGNNPSMYMTPEDQAEFIKDHLGPVFDSAGIATKIIIYDHNADRIDYPLSVLANEKASKYIDGTAFHLYGGTIDALSEVHEAFPDKNLYFTEQWVGGPGNFTEDINWHVENLIIGATRNWCKNVLEWNLAADSELKPHTDNGGCTRCLGAVTIDGDEVTRNPAYYIIAHASKFVRDGSVRISSNMIEGLPNVAFKTPDGHIVIIVQNTSNKAKGFKVSTGNFNLSYTLNKKSVYTIKIPAARL
jgi:glucosylceramidase